MDRLGAGVLPVGWSRAPVPGAAPPSPDMRAEFLYAGLQVAESDQRRPAQKKFYQRLTRRHGASEYVKEARRALAPGSRLQAGKKVAAFQLPKLSDSTATFARDDFERKTVPIDFWETSCPSCIRAMPHLQEAYRTHGGESCTILSVAMRDTRL